MRAVTNIEKMSIVQMRIDGYTMQAIAEKKGISKQRVHRILCSICDMDTQSRRYKYLYGNILNWMLDNHVQLKTLAENIGVCTSTLGAKLQGKKDFNMSEIKKILKITGMTFEEAFKETKNEEE